MGIHVACSADRVCGLNSLRPSHRVLMHAFSVHFFYIGLTKLCDVYAGKVALVHQCICCFSFCFDSCCIY